jgi:hypothetical protein
MRSMSERPDPHANEAIVGPQGQPDDHAVATAHGDHDDHRGAAEHGAAADHGAGEHGHAGEALGPIDLQAWGAAAIGAVLGLVVLLAFVQALV